MPVLWLLGAVIVAMVLLMSKTASAEAFANGQSIGTIQLTAIAPGQFLRTDAAESYNMMSSDAAQDGVSLVVDSAFRSMVEQQALYDEKVAGTRTTAVARPGYSNHQNGIAVDIAVQSSTQSVSYQWLSANAADYGFYNVGSSFNPPEYWHWEYHA